MTEPEALKPGIAFGILSVVSVVGGIVAMSAVLWLFEKQLGTPLVWRPGEEPFKYDTEVMPCAPCFGSIGYLIVANGFYYPVVLAQIPPFGRKWWIAAFLGLVIPFVIPVLLIVSAIFGTPSAPVYFEQ